MSYGSPHQLEILSEEFTEFQLLEEGHIPERVREAATVFEDKDREVKYYRMDQIWHYLASMKDADESFKFSRLANVAKLVLVLPHSNAQEERVFSMVRKNKTAFRPSLDPKGTLSCILTIKLSNIDHSFEPNKETLKKAKSATYEYNREHK